MHTFKFNQKYLYIENNVHNTQNVIKYVGW